MTNKSTIKKLYSRATRVWQKPVLISSVMITGLLLGIRQIGGLQPFELMEFDSASQLKPEIQQDQRIVVVEITEADIQTQKQWPLSDQTVAKLLAKLQSNQPKVIGLDLHRDLPQPPGNKELLKELQAPNIIAITKLSDTENRDVPPPPGIPKEQIGFNDLVLDSDGVIRRNFMYAFVKTTKYYSFGLQVSLNYLKDRNITLKVNPNAIALGKTIFPALQPNSGGYQNVDASGYQVLLNYRSRNIAKRLTLTQVLNGKFDPIWVKDKVVLIGTTALSGKDFFLTPYNAGDRQKAVMPGVLVHAQMISQILSTVLDAQPLFWFFPQWLEALWVWGWSLVGGILVWRFRHPLSLGITGTIAIGGLFGIWFACFINAGWIPFVLPALALVATGGSVGVYKLFYDAFYDALTNLPNRALFLKQVQKSIRIRQGNHFLVAIIFLDLDRFQIINDSFGHTVGDQLLLAVTQRLKKCLHPTDKLARIGGDEFAILLTGISNVNQATILADEMQTEITKPFNLKGQEIFITACFGIAFNRIDREQPDIITLQGCQSGELLRDAHTAMYRAKALGKARYEVFSTGMRSQVVTRLQLETDLHRAVDGLLLGTSPEFLLNYQAIVSLATGKIAGFEALVRWQQPQGKFISPVDFIPVAEETNLIIPLGLWIFQESCRQLQIWQRQFPLEPPLMLSINLSGGQFSQPNLIEQIAQTLKETEIDGHTLKLEITESIAMNDVEAAIETILRLKALNLRFSIDDFGTGYSSLSYLHRFPVDTLKIDRSFVSRMEETSEDAAIVQTIISLSHNLGMDIVAEGVETEAQMEKLRELQCEYGQGYFFSKPLSSELATALLATQPQW
ncbi:MAG: EAL domain-containing protein [Crinalium sp.]